MILKVFVLATSALKLIIEDFEFASQQICDCKQKLTSHKLIPDLQYGLGAKPKKKIVPFPPLGRKVPLIPCIRHTSRVLSKPCFTKLSVVISL